MKSVIVKLSAVSDEIPGIYDRQHRHRKIDRMGHRKVIGGFSSSFREIIKMLKKNQNRNRNKKCFDSTII